MSVQLETWMLKEKIDVSIYKFLARIWQTVDELVSLR